MHFISMGGKSSGETGAEAKWKFEQASHQGRDAQSFSTLARTTRAPVPQAMAVADVLAVFLPYGYISLAASSSMWLPA